MWDDVRIIPTSSEVERSDMGEISIVVEQLKVCETVGEVIGKVERELFNRKNLSNRLWEKTKEKNATVRGLI